MPDIVTILKSWRLALLPVLMLGLCAFPIAAQESESETEVENKTKTQDGHDRPTSYPKIRFTRKAAVEGKGEAKVDEQKLKTRVYLVDVSSAMSTKITVGQTETTRLEVMVAQMSSSLDALARRKDPRLRFNIITFGTVKDFAEGAEPAVADEANARRAKEWLTKLTSGGEADIFEMLKECFEQAPESATMIIGAMPATPAGLDEAQKKELANHKNAGEYLLEQVKLWRKDKATTLDITGVALSAEEKEFYKRLAEAAGGTYLDA